MTSDDMIAVIKMDQLGLALQSRTVNGSRDWLDIPDRGVHIQGYVQFFRV